MYYSEDLIEEVRSRNDIVEVISMYVKLTKKGSTYFGLCPFHNEKTPSFSVSPGKQMYYCFGCGAGGNVITFLMNYENLTFPEALQKLAERAGISLPKEEMSGEAKKEASLKNKLLEMNKAAGRYFYYQLKGELGKKGYDYLKGRGLTDETIRHFGLGYSNPYSDDLYKYLKNEGFKDEDLKESGLVKIDEKGAYDKFWNRVMYPIMDVNNRIIGFGGRVMGDGEPKYMNSPETKLFDKSRNLYGLNYARNARKNYLICCEGYMDVISMHQAGFTNAVASLGTAFTPQQASLLKRYTSQVVLAYDSDGAGVKAALRAIPILRSAGLSVKVLNMRPHKDPDEFMKNLGAEAFEKRIEEAENFFLFQALALFRTFDMEDPEQKTRFYHKLAEMLLEFEDELERNTYLEAVCNRFSIPVESMRKLVADLSRRVGLVPREKEREEKRPLDKNAPKDNGMKKAQRMLLTWLAGDPNLYPKLKDIISETDFTEVLYRKVADMLFAQLREKKANPAEILSHFIEGDEEYREVARVFNTEIGTPLSLEEQEKAIQETVIRVKKNSLDERSRKASDFEELQKIFREQAELKKWKISLK